jgi:hypothetical protein
MVEAGTPGPPRIITYISRKLIRHKNPQINAPNKFVFLIIARGIIQNVRHKRLNIINTNVLCQFGPIDS